MVEALKGLNKEQKHNWGPPNGETGDMFRERIGQINHYFQENFLKNKNSLFL